MDQLYGTSIYATSISSFQKQLKHISLPKPSHPKFKQSGVCGYNFGLVMDYEFLHTDFVFLRHRVHLVCRLSAIKLLHQIRLEIVNLTVDSAFLRVVCICSRMQNSFLLDQIVNQPFLKTKHTDRNLHTHISNLVSCRLREGYTLKQVNLLKGKVHLLCIVFFSMFSKLRYKIQIEALFRPFRSGILYHISGIKLSKTLCQHLWSEKLLVWNSFLDTYVTGMQRLHCLY